MSAQEAMPDPVVANIAGIVQDAVTDSATRTFSRIPFHPSQKTIESGLILRAYFGAYLGRLIQHLKEAKRSNIADVARSIDTFLSNTWMNHLLDSSVDTYVIKDYLIELTDLLLAKGGALQRLPQDRIEYLSMDWARLSQPDSESEVNRDSLETVLSSLPRSR